MRVFIDVLSDSEIGSDAGAVVELKEYDNTVFSIESRQIFEGDVAVDIGDNPSAEETQEALEDGATQVINLVAAHSLQKLDLPKKKDFKVMIKMFFSALKNKYADDAEKSAEIKQQTKVLQKFIVNEILRNFKEFDFYYGDGASLDSCMIVPARWVGNATSPTFFYFKIGIREEKY